MIVIYVYICIYIYAYLYIARTYPNMYTVLNICLLLSIMHLHISNVWCEYIHVVRDICQAVWLRCHLVCHFGSRWHQVLTDHRGGMSLVASPSDSLSLWSCLGWSSDSSPSSLKSVVGGAASSKHPISRSCLTEIGNG